jgi:hypothetical protein
MCEVSRRRDLAERSSAYSNNLILITFDTMLIKLDLLTKLTNQPTHKQTPQRIVLESHSSSAGQEIPIFYGTFIALYTTARKFSIS